MSTPRLPPKVLPLLLSLLLTLLLPGCRPATAPPPTTTPDRREFPTRGVVREIAPDQRHAVIRHEEIPGYMPRMTMQLNVRDPAQLTGLTPGDEIEFTLVATAHEHWIEKVRPTGQRQSISTPPTPPLPPVAELKPGDPMPDFAFVDEHGQSLRVTTFRGSALAFTFFFTRCPLPEFCPRMARHFADARSLVLQQADAPTNWQFLCLSFDPEFDSPTVLKSYASAYRGSNPTGWLFGTVTPQTLAAVAPALDLTVTRENGGFSHNLRTVVVDPLGRIHRQFDGNEWTAAQLADALLQAARLPPPAADPDTSP